MLWSSKQILRKHLNDIIRHDIVLPRQPVVRSYAERVLHHLEDLQILWNFFRMSLWHSPHKGAGKVEIILQHPRGPSCYPRWLLCNVFSPIRSEVWHSARPFQKAALPGCMVPTASGAVRLGCPPHTEPYVPATKHPIKHWSCRPRNWELSHEWSNFSERATRESSCYLLCHLLADEGISTPSTTTPGNFYNTTFMNRLCHGISWSLESLLYDRQLMEV